MPPCPTEWGPEHQRKINQIFPWGGLPALALISAVIRRLRSRHLALKRFCLSVQELIVYIKTFCGKILAVPPYLLDGRARGLQHRPSTQEHPSHYGGLLHQPPSFPKLFLGAWGLVQRMLLLSLLGTRRRLAGESCVIFFCCPLLFSPVSLQIWMWKIFWNASLISVFPAFWSWFTQERLTKARLFTWRQRGLWMKRWQLEFLSALKACNITTCLSQMHSDFDSPLRPVLKKYLT